MGKLSSYRKCLQQYYVDSVSNLELVKIGDTIRGIKEDEYSYLTTVDQGIYTDLSVSSYLSRPIESCGLPMTVTQAFFSAICSICNRGVQFPSDKRICRFLEQALSSVAGMLNISDHVKIDIEHGEDISITILWIPQMYDIFYTKVGFQHDELDTHGTMFILEPDWKVVAGLFAQAVFGRQYYSEAAMALISLFFTAGAYSFEAVNENVTKAINEWSTFSDSLGITVSDFHYLPEPLFCWDCAPAHTINNSMVFHMDGCNTKSIVIDGWYKAGETFKQHTDEVVTEECLTTWLRDMELIMCDNNSCQVFPEANVKIASEDDRLVVSDFPGVLLRYIAAKLTYGKDIDREKYLHWLNYLLVNVTKNCCVPELLTQYIDKRGTFGGVKDNG